MLTRDLLAVAKILVTFDQKQESNELVPCAGAFLSRRRRQPITMTVTYYSVHTDNAVRATKTKTRTKMIATRLLKLKTRTKIFQKTKTI